MAAASGLTLVKPDARDPLKATTFGTGQLIRHALKQGQREFVIGLGGSATIDGGAGAAAALGISYRTRNGKEITSGGDLVLLGSHRYFPHGTKVARSQKSGSPVMSRIRYLARRGLPGYLDPKRGQMKNRCGSWTRGWRI